MLKAHERDSLATPVWCGRIGAPVAWGVQLAILAMMAGCSRSEALPEPIAGLGRPDRGEALISQYGCGRCHTIPGVRAANGVVGPPLYFFSRRTYIAGELPNTPDNLVRWIRDPQAVESGTAMPNLGIGEQQARDIAAFLYTLR